MVHDPLRAAELAALKALDFGDVEPEREGDDMPKKRRTDTWTPADVERYFVWRSRALYIPLTNKRDLAKFGDVLCGLGTKLKYLAHNAELSDFQALTEAGIEIEHAKRRLKLLGKMPTRQMLQEERKKQKLYLTDKELTQYLVEKEE